MTRSRSRRPYAFIDVMPVKAWPGGIEHDAEPEYRVTYAVIWGRPAQISGPPERCYEADPDEIEITKVECSLGGGRFAPIDQREAESVAEWFIENRYDQMIEEAAEVESADAERTTEANIR